jgi:sugar O-acyltransferase (sialic acid O-acetyltransferase NeuD family)
MTPPLPVIVLGYGGHAAVVIDALQQMGRYILGAVGPTAPDGTRPQGVAGVTVMGDEAELAAYAPHMVELAHGVGGGNVVLRRRALFDTWHARGYRFVTVIHPSAVVSPHAVMNEGVQIMAGAIVQARSQLGTNALVNTGASIDHDCCIGDHAHIAPRVTLCGNVTIGAGTLVGAGSVVTPGSRIAGEVLVRAGTVVTGDWPERS